MRALLTLALLCGCDVDSREILALRPNEVARNRVTVAGFGLDDSGNPVGSSQVGYGAEKFLFQLQGTPDVARVVTLGLAAIGNQNYLTNTYARPVAIVEFGNAPDDARQLIVDIPMVKEEGVFAATSGEAERGQDFLLLPLPASFIRVSVRNDVNMPLALVPTASAATGSGSTYGAVTVAGWAAYGDIGGAEAPRRLIPVANNSNRFANLAVATVKVPQHARSVRVLRAPIDAALTGSIYLWGDTQASYGLTLPEGHTSIPLSPQARHLGLVNASGGSINWLECDFGLGL